MDAKARLEELKNELLAKHRMDALVNPEQHKEQTERLAKGLRDIPVRQMIECMQYLESEMMPAVKKKKGEDSADYKFFYNCWKCMGYAVMLADRYDYLHLRYMYAIIDKTLLTEHLALAEKELAKYCNAEDVFLSDFADQYVKGAAKHVESTILSAKK
jgi:hypothetical protein